TKLTPCTTPACSASATSSRASSGVMHRGFSENPCLPARRIWQLSSACRWFGVQLCTACRVGSASSSSTLAQACGTLSWCAFSCALTSEPSQSATTCTNPRRLSASICAGPIIPLPIIPTLIMAAPCGEIIKRPSGNRDDMTADKFTALTRAGIAILQAALPLQHRPAVVVVLGQLAENALKVDLSVAGRAEASGAVDPRLVAAVDAAAPAGAKLGVLHVERFNARMVDINKGQIVHLLEQQMAWIVENITARMVIDQRQKTLEGDAVVQIFPRMQLKADVHALLVE